MDDNSRQVFVLLTKHSDKFSLFILFLIRGYFSHASIGFDEEKGRFYSFTRRGFHVEDPVKIAKKRPNVKCALYTINVSQEDYDAMRECLESFHQTSTMWKFNIIGVLLGVIRFPFWRRRYRRFCSQFVAEVLESGKAHHLKKRSSLVFPDDFAEVSKTGPAFLGTLEGLNTLAY